MMFTKRVLKMAALFTALSSIASGYYHFVYFASRSGQFTPIRLQFDLSQLSNNTVHYFISEQGPNVFMPGDSFPAVISELQLAAQAWNSIPGSSQLKLAYGGLQSPSTQQSAPGIEVVFDDDNIAPGILAQTKVTTYSNVSFINSTTPFLPILNARIQFRKNLTVTSPQQASFYDSSFTTMVHEFGHAIGLQHTLTSATMSTYVTRSTTKAMPLAADDIAGVSLLYPTPGYLATTGSISGQVTLNGGGVNLASVVALSPTTGAAISSLTNPDGTYRIDAIPTGNYLIYVHPLPPAGQGEAGPDAIVLPQDPAQIPFPANTGFVTQFFPGTRDWTQAVSVGVSPANLVERVNFNVQGSAGPAVYGMQLSGFVNNAVEASPILPPNGAFSLEFYAPGTTTSSHQLVPGLNVGIIGSTAPASIAAGYTQFYKTNQGYDYISMGLYTGLAQSTTPVALIVSLNNDIYVLPAAFYVAPSGAPTITSLQPGTDSTGNPTLTVSGSSLSASSTKIVFDGTPGTILSANSDGSLTVAAPVATGPYSSAIEALNADGQTSGQAIVFGNPPQYSYNYANPPSLSTNLVSVLPGTDVMIQINGSNTNFNSQTTVGFGSSDIVVKKVFVIGPTLLMVNVSVNAAAPPTATTVTVTTGLQTATLSLGMQILVADPNQISLHAPVMNLATGLAGTPNGGTAIVSVSGIPSSTAINMPGWVLTIGSQQVTPAFVNNQITFTVPGGLTTGPTIVQLTSPSGAQIPAIAMQVDGPPPIIQTVTNTGGVVISAAQPAHPGDILTLSVLGLFDGSATSNIFASLNALTNQGGIAVSVLPFTNNGIQIQLPTSLPNGILPLYLGNATRVSAPFLLNIRN